MATKLTKSTKVVKITAINTFTDSHLYSAKVQNDYDWFIIKVMV